MIRAQFLLKLGPYHLRWSIEKEEEETQEAPQDNEETVVPYLSHRPRRTYNESSGGNSKTIRLGIDLFCSLIQYKK